MARWITVTKPFDYRWPESGAITAFSERDVGEHNVKEELAVYAIEKGVATDGKATTAEVKALGLEAKPTAKARRAAAAQETADIANHVTPAERRTRAPSTRRGTRRAADANAAIDATAANLLPVDRLDGASAADDGPAAHRRGVDPAAS